MPRILQISKILQTLTISVLPLVKFGVLVFLWQYFAFRKGLKFGDL